MQPVFEYLKSNDLIRRNVIRLSSIDKLNSTKIVELAEVVVNIAEPEWPDTTETAFTHSASRSLGGSRGICEGLDHRLSAVAELARFAIMYSDKVYVENFFSDYSHSSKFYDDDELRLKLYEDLAVLLGLKPLLESGHVQFFTPHEHWCQDCLATTMGKDMKRRIDTARRELSERYVVNTSATLTHLDPHLFEIEWSAPQPYLDHEMVTTNHAYYREVHEILTAMPSILRKIERGETVKLSRSLRKKLGIHETCTNKITNSVTYGILSAEILSTHFLTNNPLDLTFLGSIKKDRKTEDRNLIAFEHLTSLVPFAADTKITDLIKIRKREEEAFAKYRQALNKAIDEFRSSGNSFTRKEAKELYSDVIAPKLADLDQSVRLAKRDLVKTAYRSVIAVVGAISFGIYTGFIPREIAEMAKVLGFTKVAIDILEKLLPLGDAGETIRNQDLYFLWRVKRLDKRISP